MAEEKPVSNGVPTLSAFDQLKLSGNTNLNRNTINCNKTSNICSPKDVKLNQVKSVLVSPTLNLEIPSNGAETENSKFGKSIDSSLPHCEGNNKTLVTLGSSDINNTYTNTSGSSVFGKSRASGCFSVSSNTPLKCVKTLQNISAVGASDNNEGLPPSTQSLSQSLTSLSSSSSSQSLQSSSSLASIGVVLPNSANLESFEVFSTPSTSSLVQNKVLKFDSNDVSNSILNNSAKCSMTSVSSSPSSSSSSLSAPLSLESSIVCAKTQSLVQIKPKNSLNTPIICAPPPKVPTNHANKIGNNKKSNSKVKNQNFGLPMLPRRLTNNNAAAVASIKANSSINMDKKLKRQSTGGEKNEQQNTTEERSNKKKRCADRYDSSESSDSGVATSLSCTDSSTASSDVSDPGSPYSPVLIGDDLNQKSNMPPQTILATANGNTNKSPNSSAATPIQNVLKSGKQQQRNQNQSQNKGPSTQQQQKNAKTQMTKVSQHVWPWSALGSVTSVGNFSEMASSPKTNGSAQSNKINNKRHSQNSSTPTESCAKKTRSTSNTSKDNVIFNGATLQQPQTTSSNKRLKAAALEESQTKITGYFKSQMKAQIHQGCLKKDQISNIPPLSPMTSTSALTASAIVSSSSSSNTVSTCKTTNSSLNKYFSLLSSQFREDQERMSNASTNLQPLPPALKKIERSKPTKIAQVAPNLRKTTAAPPLSQIEKSPKKPVAIAPRTADTRQRHEPSIPSPMKAPTTPPQQQQPAVLLTAIHIPQSSQPPQLVPTSPRQQITCGNLNATKAQQNQVTAASKIPTGPSLYQIPMMSNLVPFPNLIAANVSQLTAARGSPHHPATTAQYFLNGTVFKLQQFPPGAETPTFSIDNGNSSINTASVTTTATAIEQHAGNNKNTSSITATSFQEMLSNQFQAQQQQSVSAHNHRLHHSQPVFMATTAGLLLNAASIPAMLGPGKQAMAIQPQQIPALQPIHGSNAMMPGLSSIFSPHPDQQVQQFKQDHVMEPSTPLPQTQPPPLSVSSSAFGKLAIVKAGNTFTPSVHQVSATQPPPLVTISSGTQVVSPKTIANKPIITAKPYQQEGTTKNKRNISENVKNLWSENAPLLVVSPSIAPLPPKSPPALVYPSLIANKEEHPQLTEDIFDILKNSKNETTITLPSKQYQTEENSQEETPNTICTETSSSLLSPESTSNTIISEESIKNSSINHEINSPSSLDCSLASSSMISESPKPSTEPKPEEEESSVNISELSSSENTSTTLSPTIDCTLPENESLPKCAISPILSQPKTIRFPAKHESGHRFGQKGIRRHDGVCYWDKCNKKHESNSKLSDHMQTHHVNTQTGPFACLWLGCKVFGRESCSRRWLERHVLSHGGTKPFKCIVDGCGLRFGSQLALQKHVNGHFTATESKDSTNKRTSDPPVPKLLRKNGKKLRYRRQPFSARMFDFFDAGIMEGLNHRLRQISTLTNGNNTITFRGEILMRRKNFKGIAECLVQWAPAQIISNEWLPEKTEPFVKTLSIKHMKPNEKTSVQLLLKSAYRLPHSPNLFQSFHTLSRQSSQDSTTNYSDQSQSTTSGSTTATDDQTDETSRSSSFGYSSVLGSISDLPRISSSIELRKKQSRKQPKRIQPS